MPGGIRTRDLRTPISIGLRPAAAGKEPATQFIRRSARLSHGRSGVANLHFRTSARTHSRTHALTHLCTHSRTHALPTPGRGGRRGSNPCLRSHDPALCPAELRPPRARCPAAAGGNAARYAGSRCSTRPGTASAPPALSSSAIVPISTSFPFPGWRKTKSPRPAVSRGRGDGGRSRSGLVRARPRGVRHGPPALVLWVPPNPAVPADRSNAVRSGEFCPTPGSRPPADAARTTAAYRARPRGPPVGLRSRGSERAASHPLQGRSIYSARRGRSPPVKKNKKREPRLDVPGPRVFRGPGPAAVHREVADRAETSGRDSQGR
jgi:hypothetical protein